MSDNFLPPPGVPIPSAPAESVTPVFAPEASGANTELTAAPADTTLDTVLAPTETPAKRVTRTYSQKLVREAIDQFEADLGGRGKLLEILLGLPPDDQLADTIGLLADPTSDRVPLHQLCRAGGITLGDLYEATRKGVLVKPLLLALQKVAAKLGPIIQDVMERAAPHDVTCDTCRGLGTISPVGGGPDAKPSPCTACKGSGAIRVLPELDRQKFALELARLVPKKGDQQVFMGAGSVANLGTGTVASMTTLLKETDRLPARPRSVGRGRLQAVPAGVSDGNGPVLSSGLDGGGDAPDSRPD